jgi:hypothetical protein
VAVRISLIDSHALIPFIGDLNEAWIKGRTKTTNQVRQWIFEVTIFAFAKAMSPHVDVASKASFVVVKLSDLAAFFW